MSDRGSFNSKLGIILASAGSAVGLGNIWRFPTEVGNNGGAAFILVYLACVFLLAMPVMVSEFLIGRAAQTNTVEAYRRLHTGRRWAANGYMGVLGGFMVLSFYSVVAGWTLKYAFDSIAGHISWDADHASAFTSFVSSPWQPLACVAIFLLVTHLVVVRGIQGGIERYSKLMMPLLLAIIIVLACCSLTMPGAADGLRFLFSPDFGKVNASVVLSAMGQAFFSLSVGLGCLVTYASYFDKDTRLVWSAFNVCAIDTLVAVMSGIIIFPAVFSVAGAQADAGPGLVFITLPHIFDSALSGMPVLCYAFSSLFYLLLLLAALTSSISMHEICTAFVSENHDMPRRKAAAIVTAVCLTLGAACSLSFGPWSGLKCMGMGIFDWFDFLTAKFIMPLGGLFISIFAGWRMKRSLVEEELTNGGTLRVRCLGVLTVLIRWVAPAGVCLIFLNELLPVIKKCLI